MDEMMNIESPRTSTSSRRMNNNRSYSSPSIHSAIFKKSAATKKKLNFFADALNNINESMNSSVSMSPMTMVKQKEHEQIAASTMIIDEDSCDSGFSDSQYSELFNAEVSTSSLAEKSFELTRPRQTKSRSLVQGHVVKFNLEESMIIAESPEVTQSSNKYNSNKLAKSKSNYEFGADSSNTSKLFQKSRSSSMIHEYFNEPAIMEALEKHESESSDTRLVGDMSTTHVLPLLKTSKHQDLASIASSTMIDLLNGKYDEQVDKYLIIDARFPYEYEGGHINGAENVYLIDDLFKRLFSNPIRPEQTGKRVIVIFHCEFSSERGPRLMREVRERDRLLNQHNYPNLFYPELYLLEGGYKSFFEHSTTALEFCAPRSYLPMVHDNHRDDLKFFRRKSKTWEMETRKRIKSKLSF